MTTLVNFATGNAFLQTPFLSTNDPRKSGTILSFERH